MDETPEFDLGSVTIRVYLDSNGKRCMTYRVSGELDKLGVIGAIEFTKARVMSEG